MLGKLLGIIVKIMVILEPIGYMLTSSGFVFFFFAS